MHIIWRLANLFASLCVSMSATSRGDAPQRGAASTVEVRAMSSDSSHCENGRWAAPVPLFVPAPLTKVFARNLSFVASAQDSYIVGNNVAFFDQPLRSDETLTAWRLGHGPIGAPAGGLDFLSPKAILGSDGRLRMLWGEASPHSETIPPYHWNLLRTATIWGATFEGGRGWSQANRLYAGPVGWNRASIAIDHLQGESRALVAVPIDSAGGVLVLASERDGWSATIVAAGINVAYASILAVAGKQLLAIVAADAPELSEQLHEPADKVHDTNSVFLYAKGDRGGWHLSARLQQSRASPALEVNFVQSENGPTHLFWRQMIRPDYLVIRHIQSVDGGKSWTSPVDLVPGGLIQELRAAVDACQRVHVVYQDWDDAAHGVRIGHAMWDGQWSRPQRLHAEYAVADMTLARQQDGSVLLAFVGTKKMTSDRSGWEMLQSQLYLQRAQRAGR